MNHRRRTPLGAAALIAVAASLTSCGSDQPAVMPDVTTRRLDIALSDIERSGFDEEVEVLGGGVFGVVDESNWTVCDQEPEVGDEIGSAPRLTVDRSCKAGDKLDDEPPANPTKKQKTIEKGGDGGGGGDAFVVPSVVGMNLQDAQDTLQAAGSFVLTQTDATGMERFQMDDSNWKVCGQSPAPGERVKLSRMVDLRAVKLDEQCP